MQTTLIILKPDTVQRGLIGQIISRFEDKGLTIAGAKMLLVKTKLAEAHYQEHAGKPFYDGLINFITSSPVLVLALRGDNAIAVCRNMIGSTNGQAAAPGSIRGDFGMSTGFNLIHGSDSESSAQRELSLWFKEDQIIDYTPTRNQWIYEK